MQGETNARASQPARLPRRSMSDAQKGQRRQQILDAAWQLFQQRPYAAITMLDVAGSLGLAKGTLYIYFRTKEEMFLAVLEQQLASWFVAINTALAAERPGGKVSVVADLLCRSLEERPALVRLMALLYSILEQNVEFATALRFKRMLLAELGQTGALLEGCLTFLHPGEGATFLLRSHALVVGLQQMAEPGPLTSELLQQPGLEAFIVDFPAEFRATITALLYGLECKAVSLVRANHGSPGKRRKQKWTRTFCATNGRW